MECETEWVGLLLNQALGASEDVAASESNEMTPRQREAAGDVVALPRAARAEVVVAELVVGAEGLGLARRRQHGRQGSLRR